MVTPRKDRVVVPSRKGLKERVRSRMPGQTGGPEYRLQPRRPIPILKLIAPADLITLLNFLCGVLAVMASVDRGDGFRIAMLFILLGAIFDGLDGPVARRFGSSHNFGIWLDSIADAMTFCIAPAILVYNMFKNPGGEGPYTVFNMLVIISSLAIAIIGILRLARFSLSHHRWRDFIGLPTPAFAMIVVSLTSLHLWAMELDINMKYFNEGYNVMVPVLLLLISFVMIMDVMFRKYKGRGMTVAGFFLLIMILSLLFGVQEPMVGLMGSIIFTAASMGYLITPLLGGPGNIWGASKRMEDLDMDDLILENGTEDEAYENY